MDESQWPITLEQFKELMPVTWSTTLPNEYTETTDWAQHWPIFLKKCCTKGRVWKRIWMRWRRRPWKRMNGVWQRLNN